MNSLKIPYEAIYIQNDKSTNTFIWINNFYTKTFNIYDAPFNFLIGTKYNLKLLDSYGDGWSYGQFNGKVEYKSNEIEFTDGFELETEIIAGDNISKKIN